MCERMNKRSEIIRIDEMPAGREMDFLIAEKVFGFKHYIGEEIPDGHVHQYLRPEEVPEVWLKERLDHGGYYRYCKHCENMPEFSTDISSAWEVVEKMGELGYTCHVEWKGSDRVYAESAEVVFVMGIITVGHAVGDVTGAICRAALKAMGVTEC